LLLQCLGGTSKPNSPLELLQIIVDLLDVDGQPIRIPPLLRYHELGEGLVIPLLAPHVGDGVPLRPPDDLLQLQVTGLLQAQAPKEGHHDYGLPDLPVGSGHLGHQELLQLPRVPDGRLLLHVHLQPLDEQRDPGQLLQLEAILPLQDAVEVGVKSPHR